ncbi:rubrerythrin [Haloimpatiens massiliensis]|uniref:rubrerythrin n=1 Tax=Haloimpatiens massiliensis TaxID=1658110 RepID=UPI000C826D4F|nr:rubrerythrin family protein [Haloimpatiens massiliensis]
MKSLKGTKTAENLLKAFAGESQARNRYTYYSSTAKKQGYVQIANIFLETAENEKEHAKRFYKFLLNDLQREGIEINAAYPVALYGDTKANLKAAAAGENEEWSELYPEFARVAREEGFEEISVAFERIAEVEKHHEARYNKLVENIEKDMVFKKDKVQLWKCNNCGYIFEGEEAPEVCPACVHPKAYFEVLCENY